MAVRSMVRSTRRGPFPRFEADEIYGRVRSLLTRGFSDRAIAMALGISDRTVSRYRRAHGIANVYRRAAL